MPRVFGGRVSGRIRAPIIPVQQKEMLVKSCLNGNRYESFKIYLGLTSTCDEHGNVYFVHHSSFVFQLELVAVSRGSRAVFA